MQSVILRCLGLITDPNELVVPDGGLRLATNIIIQRKDLAQSRRGMAYHAKDGGAHNKLFTYDNYVLGHFATTGLKRLTAPTWTSAGTITSPTLPSRRVMVAEAARNLYATGSDGMYRLSGGTGTLVRAGTAKSIGIDRAGPTAVLTGSGAWLTDGSQVAYRYVFGFKDAKGNTHYGAPSSRVVISNSSLYTGYSAGVVRNVVNRILIPSGVDANFFFQVYRSSVVPVGTSPDDDLQLVYQDFVKPTDVTNGYVEITDIYPTTIPRGAFIYTSPNFGNPIGGVDGENEPPPQAQDVAEYAGRTWFARTLSKERFQLRILSVGGTEGIQNTDTLQIDNFTMTASTGAVGSGQYFLQTGGTVSQNIEATALNLVEAINKYASNTSVYAYYLSAPDDAPGSLVIEKRVAASGSFTVKAGQGSKRTCFEPVLPAGTHTVDLAKTGTAVATATVTAGTQSLRVGEQVTISPGNANFPAGTYAVTGATTTTFQYNDGVVATATLTGQTGVLASGGATAGNSVSDDWLNGLFFSKLLEVEAVPRRNFFRVGSSESEILRIVSTTNHLVIVKTDGVWRITGETPADFRLEELTDRVVRCLARESVQRLGNNVYLWTDRGFARVDEDGGFEIISKKIETTVQAAVSRATVSVLASYAFAFSYAPDGLYVCWYPDRSIDVACLKAFVFNEASGAWTQWQVFGASDIKTCGVYDPVSDRHYLGDAYGGAGDSYTWQERKAFANTDLRDDRITDPIGPTTETIAISRSISWVTQTAKEPQAMKRFSEVTVLFSGTQVGVDITYANEYGSAASNSVVSNGSLGARDWVRRDALRGKQLIVTVANSVASDPFNIAGLSVKFDVMGHRAAR